jgi:hypothetical protein
VLPDAEITPQTPIAILRDIGTDPVWQKWKWLAKNTDLDLPPLETPFRRQSDPGPWLNFWTNLAGHILICAAIVGTFVLLHILIGLSMPVSLIGTPFVFFGSVDFADAVWRRLIGDIPDRIGTIGDLAREVAGANFTKLMAEKNGCSQSDRWSALLASLLTMSGRKDPITRDTTFFANPSPATNANA